MEGQYTNVFQEAFLSLIQGRSLEPCHLGLRVVSLLSPPLQQPLRPPPHMLGLEDPRLMVGRPAWPPEHTMFTPVILMDASTELVWGSEERPEEEALLTQGGS